MPYRYLAVSYRIIKPLSGLVACANTRQALTTIGDATPMAASIFLQQSFTSRKSPISKSGVLTIHGFGVRVCMQAGHLQVEDGVGTDRRKIRLARVGHGLRRLVCVTDDGTISLSALRWVTEQKAAFVLLQRDGKVLTVCGPASPSQARLRRAQALAHHTGKALEISRKLISVKL